MAVKFQWDFKYSLEINNCGFHVVYKQDMEDIREMLSAQSSNRPASLLMRVWMFIAIQQKESNWSEAVMNMRGPKLMVKAALTMSHTQRGLKDRELMYGLLLILIARILMKVSHLYKDSVASCWAYGNLFFFFFSREVGHDTKESSLSTILFTGHLKFVSFFFFFWVKISLPLIVS